MSTETRPVMDVYEAARYLGISVDSLYDYAKQGVVPAFKMGPRWKFHRPSLDRWMEVECSKIAEVAKRKRRDARDKANNLELFDAGKSGGRKCTAAMK